MAGLVSGPRRLTSTEPNAADLAARVTELRPASPDFRRLWDRYDIDLYVTGSQELRHPEAGGLAIDYRVLRIEGEGGLTRMLTVLPSSTGRRAPRR